MRQTPLNAVRVFAVAARRLSFKQAAAELFVTPGAVSRQIQVLETHLGVQLFERRFREIALTQLGKLYLAQVGPALAGIDQASQRLRELTIGGQSTVVRVDATPGFAMHWLIPRLAGFHARHPGIEIRLGTSQGVVDRSKHVDLHIRRDPEQFNGLYAEPFMTEYCSLVCSPLRTEWRTPDTPAAIFRMPLIHMRSRPDLWPRWFSEHGLDEAQAGRRIDLDNTIFAIQAAVEGLGVGLIPRLFLDGLLASGSLICLPDSRTMVSGAYHLLHGSETLPAAVVTFVDWLKDGASGAIQ